MAKGASSYIKPKDRTTSQLDEAGDTSPPPKAPKPKQQVQAPAPPPEKKWWER